MGTGIWKEPLKTKNLLAFNKDSQYYEYRKNVSISRADKVWSFHDKNFYRIFSFDKFAKKLP